MEGTIHVGRVLGWNHARDGIENASILNLLHYSTDGIAEYEQGQVDYFMEMSLKAVEQKGTIGKDDSSHGSSTANASASKICAECKTEIGRTEQYFYANNIFWHQECFFCHACKQLIRDDKFYMFENGQYHQPCLERMKYPKCYVCNNFAIENSEHPIWKQKYCSSHENDGTFQCYSCDKLQPKGCKYKSLKDGRTLCPECFSFRIMDTNECQPLFHEIKNFFARLHMKFDQEIPLALVEREALNEALEGEKNGHHHPSETRGLFLSEERIIPILIHKRKRIGRGHVMLTQPLRLVRSCEVTAILILYGLPSLLTGSILAHEMMHAWLRLRGYPNLEPEVEEGICQVLAHKWLKSKIKLGSQAAMAANKHKLLSETEIKLGQCFIRQIELDTSPVYGGGFTKGLRAVSHYGLMATLDHIKLTRTFPL